MGSNDFMVLLLFGANLCSVEPFPKSNQASSMARTDPNCEVETTCDSINVYQCQVEKEICKETLWSRCKTIDKEIKVWKNVTECDDNGEGCEEKFKETTQTERVEHCTVETIPESACLDTSPRITCQKCKEVLKCEGERGPRISCHTCYEQFFHEHQNYLMLYNCFKDCGEECTDYFAGDSVCPNCHRPDECDDSISIKACWTIKQNFGNYKTCPLKNSPPEQPMTKEECDLLCENEEIECGLGSLFGAVIESCQDVCAVHLMPYQQCSACFHRGYTTYKLQSKCLANEFRQVTCQECNEIVDIETNPKGRIECLRRCDDFACDNMFPPSETDPDPSRESQVETCQTSCYDLGCTDFESARLCMYIIDQAFDFTLKCDEPLPGPVDPPLAADACKDFCHDCDVYKSCEDVCKSRFRSYPPHLCEYCASHNKPNLVECLRDQNLVIPVEMTK